MLIAASAILAANAQDNVSHEYEYDSFTSVCVSDDFIIRLANSDKYMLTVTSDVRLEHYIKPYVLNGTLYISVDRKSFTPELKKALRARGAAAPVLDIMISCPTLKSLELNGNSILHKADALYTDAFRLSAGDKARIDNLIIDCKTAEITLSKNSYAELEVKASERLYLNTMNASKASVKHSGEEIIVDAAGSSNVNVIAETEDLKVVSAGGSLVTLVSGKASRMTANASGSSRIDAEAVAIQKAAIEQVGTSRCHVNITDTLTVNLTGNSMLTFKDKPYIDVERIVGSTLIKHDDPRRK